MEITEVPAYMRANLASENLTISYLSRQCFMSASLFKMKIKALVGMPFGAYKTSLKMHAAAELLTNGKFGCIQNVGYKLGYTNLSQFAAAFGRYYGHLPSDVFIKKVPKLNADDTTDKAVMKLIMKLHTLLSSEVRGCVQIKDLHLIS